MVYKAGPLLDSSGHDQHLRTSSPSTNPGQLSESTATEQNTGEDSDVEEEVVFRRKPMKETKREKKRVFGLTQDKNLGPAYTLPDDYEKRYPYEEWGQEMGPNARVWRVYLDEAELNDRDMVEGWKDGIDVLLVFAGLFSAVVTTLVVQTSQKLDQDPGQISASMLTQLTALQWALATGSSLDDVSPLKLNLSSPQYSTSDAWVNGLWFTSLTLSLVTALYAVLVKQWVQNYVSFISGTPQERARVHHFRYMGIQRWSVPAIIGVLPMLLYAALFLFILGLVVFLQALKLEIAFVVGSIGGIAFMVYVVTNALPVFYPQCPYRTPLIEHVRFMICHASFVVRQVTFPLTHRLIPKLLLRTWAARLHHRFSYLKGWCEEALDKRPPSYKVEALKASESKAAEKIQDGVVLEVIRWLLTSSSNPSVKPIVLQSISGLPFGYSHIDDLLGNNSFVQNELLTQFESLTAIDLDLESFIDSPLFYTIERILRASMLIPTSIRYGFVTQEIPITRGHFQMLMKIRRHDVTLQQSLTTYIIHHATTRSICGADDWKPIAFDIMRTLLDVLDTADKHPMIWIIWFKSLGIRENAFGYPDISLAGAYNSFKPVFNTLLDTDCSPMTWATVAPFVRRILPSRIVEGHDNPLDISPAIIERGQTRLCVGRFCAMLIKGVIEECKSGQNSVAELEDVIIAAMERLLIRDLSIGWDGQPPMTSHFAVLVELCNQSFFPNDSWSSQTYRTIFSVYLNVLGLFERQPASFPSSTPTPLQSLSDILSNETCTSGLIGAFCFRASVSYLNLVIHNFSHQITQHLDALKAPNPQREVMVKNLLACFNSLDGMPDSLAPLEDHVVLQNQWPIAIQPLVQWMLEQIIAQDEAEHPDPTIQIFTTKLLERADVLTFICSSFLIDSDDELTFGKESHILLQLATYHRGKPGAADIWRAFLSWVVAKSAKLNRAQSESWCIINSQRYASMASFVNQLMNMLGLDGAELRLPPLVDDNAQIFAGQENGSHNGMAVPAEGLPAQPTSLFRKLICWKAHPDADANREEIGLKSNECAVAS